MNSAELTQYEERIRKLRKSEYPSIKDAIYLDHAGTTPIPKSLIERFSADLVSNLYGNPHSGSPSSQLSTGKIDAVRHDTLQFFNADPANFDLVFVANATAGAKLVMDAFRDSEVGFWYGYHKDCHTSLVGIREAAALGNRCFGSDSEVDEWVQGSTPGKHERRSAVLELFAYPAQSNMNGQRRLSFEWCRNIRRSSHEMHNPRYSLLDAAALVSTSSLDLSDPDAAPDFTVLSFYKIFGYPDLGALIVRKESGGILRRRKYFGGGTVDMVVSLKEEWHAKKSDVLHSACEDGTLPIHSIFALGHAIDVHRELFGRMQHVSQHTAKLATMLHDALSSLHHANGVSLCKIYMDKSSCYTNPATQGPIVAFNLRTSLKAWVSNTEFEKLASIRDIHIRSGGLCNPGGTASSLELEPWEMTKNFAAGQRCGNENDIMGGKPTGIIRASFGAMSVTSDVERFVDFLREFYLETNISATSEDLTCATVDEGDFYVESLTIYPIKSCGAWRIPDETSWAIRHEGLAWNREWCLVHRGTGAALNQKQHPRMALIRPRIDLVSGMLRVRYLGGDPSMTREVAVPLSADPRVFGGGQDALSRGQDCTVCGDDVKVNVYTLQDLSEFFTSALGVPCQLARFPLGGTSPSLRHSKAHLYAPTERSIADKDFMIKQPILFSNESPILVISRSSLNRLNELIKLRNGRAVQADVFRANIIVAQGRSLPGQERPYIEDTWTELDIGGCKFQVLGACRRCQMLCVDQQTANKNEEPLVTLAKTRRSQGKVWFGIHTCMKEGQHDVGLRVGDRVLPSS